MQIISVIIFTLLGCVLGFLSAKKQASKQFELKYDDLAKKLKEFFDVHNEEDLKKLSKIFKENKKEVKK